MALRGVACCVVRASDGVVSRAVPYRVCSPGFPGFTSAPCYNTGNSKHACVAPLPLHAAGVRCHLVFDGFGTATRSYGRAVARLRAVLAIVHGSLSWYRCVVATHAPLHPHQLLSPPPPLMITLGHTLCMHCTQCARTPWPHNLCGRGFEDGVDAVELVLKLQKQAGRFGAKFKNCVVEKVDITCRPFKVHCTGGPVLTSSAIIVATGASARWLGAKGEQKYAHLLPCIIMTCCLLRLSLK